MPKPEPCEKCGAEPQERRHCPHCGEAECRRQSRLIAADPHEKEILDWIGQAADTSGWV